MLYLYIIIVIIAISLGYWLCAVVKKSNREMAEARKRDEEKRERYRLEMEVKEDRQRRTRVETKKDAVFSWILILRVFSVEIYFDEEKIGRIEAEWLCAINETTKVSFWSKEAREGWELQENGWYKFEEEMKVFEVIQNYCPSRLDRLCEEFFEAKLPRRSHEDREWLPADMR